MNSYRNGLPPTIRSALRRLRRKIRRYIIFEGIALVVIALGITFWAMVVIDYVPVYLFGLSELPWLARVIALTAIGAMSIWILYYWVFRKLFVELKDGSLALLLERAFPQFNESLITTVEAPIGPTDASGMQMLERTRLQAQSVTGDVDVAAVIDTVPLMRKITLAAMLGVTICAFAFFLPHEFKIAGSRLYLLDNQTWPRRCNIEVIGIKIKWKNFIDGIDELNQTIEPENSEFKVAVGASLTLLVRAETDSNESGGSKHTLPGACVVYYRTAGGARGEQPLKRIGVPRDGYQSYSLDGQPFQGILSDLTFTIRGGDHRVGPFRLKVVDSPAIMETGLACEFPEYMVDPVSMRWTPRTIRWTGNMSLPQGTRITVGAKSNKRLKKVYAYDLETNRMQLVLPEMDKFIFSIDSLDRPVNIQFYLCDLDGVVSEEPHLISIEPVEDQPPRIQTKLEGIGTAITPEAMIRIRGSIEDDYGVARQWVSIETPVSAPIIEEFQTNRGEIDTNIDFQKRRQASRDNISLPAGEGSQIVVMVRAEDRFNLSPIANVGFGDRYVLDVVSAGELLRILEGLEVGQRRRLEQISIELGELRDYLVRSKSSQRDALTINEPGDARPDGEPERAGSHPSTDLADRQYFRDDELRTMFAQRAMVQTGKSIREILGVAIEFESIREQLVNNRVDSENRKQRLSIQIVAPLRLIANGSMRQLMQHVKSLENLLGQLQEDQFDRGISDTADSLANKSIEQLDEALVELNGVLSVLVKYETQNELLDIVRQMIKQQQELAGRTKKERKRKAFEGLLD